MKNKTRGEFSFRWFKGINEINKAGGYADDMHERKTKRLRSVKYGREILETRTEEFILNAIVDDSLGRWPTT